MSKNNVHSLRQSIAIAESSDSINSLLKTGFDTYSEASERTKRSWKYSARRRLLQLQSTESKVDVVDNTDKSTESKPAKKKYSKSKSSKNK